MVIKNETKGFVLDSAGHVGHSRQDSVNRSLTMAMEWGALAPGVTPGHGHSVGSSEATEVGGAEHTPVPVPVHIKPVAVVHLAVDPHWH